MLDKLMNVETILFLAAVLSLSLFVLLFVRQRGIMVLFVAFFICSVVLTARMFKLDLPGPDFTLPRLVFVMMVGYAFVAWATGNVKLLPFSRLDKWMVINLMVLTASMLVYGAFQLTKQEVQPLSLFINGFLMPFVTYWLAKNFVSGEQEVRVVLWTFFLIGVYLSVTAIFEIYGPKALVWPQYILDHKVRMHWGRARGPFLNAATNGGLIVIGFACGAYLRSNTQGFTHKLITLLLILFPVAVFLTRTRAVWLAFLAVVLILGLFAPGRFLPRWRFLIIPVAILVVFVGFKAESFLTRSRAEGGVLQISPITDRVALAQIAFRMARDRPLFGFGLGRYPQHSTRYLGKIGTLAKPAQYAVANIQHNLFLGTLVDTGLIGILALLFLLWIIWRYSLWLYRIAPNEGFFSQSFVTFFWAVFAAYIIATMFILPWYFLFFNVQFYVLVGVMAGVYERRGPVKASALRSDRRLARRHARPQHRPDHP
ncbi:MAG: O-antigen ligase family protein [Proteobacteria bacterium]|nr:O-antigen ligase family protein [Pseudomonadota bacterium]MBU1743052.1 O-antigen ligase family protein [Pseudomonadota bacterium]